MVEGRAVIVGRWLTHVYKPVFIKAEFVQLARALVIYLEWPRPLHFLVEWHVLPHSWSLDRGVSVDWLVWAEHSCSIEPLAVSAVCHLLNSV